MNCVLCRDSKCYVPDFGIACFLPESRIPIIIIPAGATSLISLFSARFQVRLFSHCINN